MTKPLITLPCTAQELENALHAVCDHHGAWDAKIFVGVKHYENVPMLTLDIFNYTSDNTKGEAK